LDVPQKDTLQVKTNLNDLNLVLTWFETFNRADIPRSVWLQCQSALAEAFTNAVRHAHADLDPETSIEIWVAVELGCLQFAVWDWGKAFDLAAALAQLPQGVDARSGGGRGLQIMHKVADHLDYSPTPDGRNRLLLVKYFQPVAPTSSPSTV
jgi:serine/threonine-protein kinase RsbW